MVNFKKLLIISIVIIGVTSGLFLIQKNLFKIQENQVVDSFATVSTTKSYNSKIFGINFVYPKNWTVYEDENQIDVQPPPPAQWSNYFTIEIIKDLYLPKDKGMVKQSIIDGETAYLIDPNPSEENELLYLRFAHNNKTWIQPSNATALVLIN